MKKPPITPADEVTAAIETPKAPTQPKESPSAEQPVAWEEFLEDEGDCCGGCNHKPR